MIKNNNFPFSNYHFPIRRSAIKWKLEDEKWKIAGGYSLIELLVVLSLFSILVLVATQTLLLSLRGANKSESVGRAKENVEYAISIMERQLRNARDVDPCPNPDPLVINYSTYDGDNSSFSCVNPGVDGYIASGSARLTNQDIGITKCSITCSSDTATSPQVTISVTGEDNSIPNAVEKGQATSETTVVLRQY